VNMDPYKELGVSPGASRDEIRDAYGKLAKKYHPDRFQEDYMKELAEEKMKKINEAYDFLMKGASSRSSSASSSRGSQTAQNTANEEPAFFRQVRQLLQGRRFQEAFDLLNTNPVKNAEWYYLAGVSLMNLGQYETGLGHLEKAVSLEPQNVEYVQAFQQARNASFFTRRAGYVRGGGASCCEICAAAWCLDTCCECGGGDCITCC